jgi:hypothetical protein
MKSSALFGLVLLFATSNLFADLTVSTTSPAKLTFPSPEGPIGSNFDGGITVFGPGGGAFLVGANLTFPGGSTGPNPFVPGSDTSLTITSTPVGGGSEKLLISWSQIPLGTSLIPPGSLLGGAPITTIGFEIGSANFGGNGLEWTPSVPFTVDSVVFTLFDVGGGVLFTTPGIPAIVNPDGSLGFAAFIGAGGADLSAFGIAGASVSITITEAVIPEPSTFALLSFIGIIGSLRRRH